jgi:geranylgeranylglycerol-phosphate geranylgeranyltransferase
MGFSAYIRLFRIEHALMLVFAVLFAEFLAAGADGTQLPGMAIIILSLCVPLFIEMGSFALNDYFDVKTDKANRRLDRPIAAGEISPKAALVASAVAYAIGIAASLALPAPCIEIAVAFAALSILYDWKLKDLPLLGNAYIACSMAIPFLFGGLVVSETLHPALLAIAGVAAVAGLGREIIKSIEDVEGDVKHRKSKTLPAVIGKGNAAGVAAA